MSPLKSVPELKKKKHDWDKEDPESLSVALNFDKYMRRENEMENTETSPPGASKKQLSQAVVYKQSDGRFRWITFSSNAYQDRDREIVSTKALEEDIARADKEGDYGPLRWWHVGKPDPVGKTAGPGLDIGVCDFNALHGRILIESGTFYNDSIGERVKEAAGKLQVSIGYFHPPTEPDSEGVFHNIRRFERSLLPRGRASNPLTAIPVIQTKESNEMITDKLKAFASLLKDEELVDQVLKNAEMIEKEADENKTAFKESENEIEDQEPELEIETKHDDSDQEPEPEIEDMGGPFVGDMHPTEFAELLAGAIGEAIEPYRRQVKELQNAVSQKDDQAAALKESQAQIAGQIKDLQARLKELEGEAPKALKSGYRASQDEETVVSDKSYDEPHVDAGFLEFMGGKKANQ